MAKKKRLGTKTASGLIRAVNLQGKRVTVSQKTLLANPKKYFVNRKTQMAELNRPRLERKRALARIKKELWYTEGRKLYTDPKATREEVMDFMREDFIQVFESHRPSERIGLTNGYMTRIEQEYDHLLEERNPVRLVLSSLGISPEDYLDSKGHVDTSAIIKAAREQMGALAEDEWDLWYYSQRAKVESTFRYEKTFDYMG